MSTTINVKTKISNCTLIKFLKSDLRFVVKTKDSLSLIIYKTFTIFQSQARPQVAAVPQYRGGHNQYRVHVHHAPPPTLTSVPIQVGVGVFVGTWEYIC